MVSIERHGFLGPVTALCWSSCDKYVLCGRGTSLLAITPSRRIVSSIEAFESSRVSGIKSELEDRTYQGERDCSSHSKTSLQSTIVVAHGDKNVMISRLEAINESKTPRFTFLIDLLDLDDWILDVQLIKDSSKLLSSLPDPIHRRQPFSTDWGRLAVGFAHNFVEIWQWASRERLQVPCFLSQPALRICNAIEGAACAASCCTRAPYLVSV